MRPAILAAALSLALVGTGGAQAHGTEGQQWPEELEAVTAAPRSHRVLHEDDEVRVLLVTVAPQTREEIHTHEWPSVMVIEESGPSVFRVYELDDEGDLELVSERESQAPERLPLTIRLPPEAPHSFENRGSTPFRAIRVEFKRAFEVP